LIPTAPNNVTQGSTRILYIDGLLSVANCAWPFYLTSFPFERSCTSKTTGWFTKDDPNYPTLTKCYSRCTRILIYIDGLLSVAQTVPNRCYLTFFHFPERSIALVKRLAGSPKGWNDPNLPHANKVLLKVARILIYIDGLLSVAQTVPQPSLTFFHFPERSIALVKRLAGSPKGWNWSQPAR
jgi:hypothetical protein